MKCISDLDQGRQCIARGDVIAYPTEAVYGLGCDPFNQEAVERLLELKCRPSEKGLIILIAQWHQLFALVDVPEALLAPVKNTWPGPVTWVFPKTKILPVWVSGDHDTVAIRMSAHSIARQLCQDMPIISTSANISGQPPAMNLASLERQFPQGIDVFIEGPLGGASQPSQIYDVMTQARLR